MRKSPAGVVSLAYTISGNQSLIWTILKSTVSSRAEAYGLVLSTAGRGAFVFVAGASSSSFPSDSSSSSLSLGGSMPAVAGCMT